MIYLKTLLSSLWRKSRWLLLFTPLIRSAGWEPTSDLSGTFSDIRDPEVVIDAAGNSVAVWRFFDGVEGNTLQGATIAANSLTWTPTGDLSDSAGAHAIAVDQAGNVIAIWGEDLGANYEVRSSRLPFGSSTWDAPLVVSTTLSDTDPTPQIVIDPTGNAIAVWSEDTAGAFVTKAATLPFAAGAWDPEAPLSVGGTASTAPHVAVDASGNAVAVWVQGSGVTSEIQASSYTFGGAWSSASSISTSVPTNTTPRVVVSDAGDAVAVWNWDDGSGNHIVQSSTLPFAGVWSVPTNVSSSPSETSTAPDLAIDGTGNTIVVWSKGTGSASVIKSARLAQGSTTWTSLADVGDSNSFPSQPAIAMDSSGNAVVVWRYRSNDTTIQVASLTTGSSVWSIPLFLTPNILGFQNASPDIALNNSGSAVAIWAGYRDGQGYASSVQGAINQNPFAPLSPLDFKVGSYKKVFATQTEYLNLLTWQANHDGSPALFYRIFRDSIKIASVLAPQTSFIDHNRKKGVSYIYSITAVNDSGSSEPVTASNI